MIDQEAQTTPFCCENCERQHPVSSNDITTFDEATGEEKIGLVGFLPDGNEKIGFRKSKAGVSISVATCPTCKLPMYQQ